MRRFLPAAVLAALMAAVASRADAGYLIIRVILEGNAGGAAGTPGVGGVGGLPDAPPPPTTGVGPMRVTKGSPFGPPPGKEPPPPGKEPPPPPKHVTAASGADPTRSIVVIVPIDEDLTVKAPFYAGRPYHPTSNPTWSPKLALDHRDQKVVTNVFTDSTTVQLYETLKERPAFKRTFEMDVAARHAKWAKTKTDFREGYDVLVKALEIGMAGEAVKYADQLLAAAREKKDGVPPEVEAFAKAYGVMQKGIAEAPGKRGPAERWQGQLEATVVTPRSHYTLLSWDATDAETKRRLDLLEENFRGFFLSHAVRGIALPVPDAPLVAVLPRQGNDVFRLLGVFDGPPRLPADGFYAPDHDVLVLSPERLDSVGRTFNAQTQQMYQGGVARAELLAGKGPKIDKDGKDGAMKPDAVARMQTIALVERLADDAAATAAISREGSLQLLYATGQLPRHVVLPEWLTNGATNYFTRPKDPAFLTTADGKWLMHVSPTTGFGGLNHVLQRHFRDQYGGLIETKADKKDAKEQRESRLALLRNTITDAYFLGLRDPKAVNDPDPVKADKSGVALGGKGPPTGGPTGMPPTPIAPPRPMPGVIDPAGTGAPTEEDLVAQARKKRARLGVKAQASAWALYYYLARGKPAQLRAYAAELAALPRDLPLDATTMTTAFSRAFGLDGSNESLSAFADAWMTYFATFVPQAGIDIPLVEPKAATGGAPPPTDMPPPKGP